MTPVIGFVILCILCALGLGASIVDDLVKAAYAKGRKDADAWWLHQTLEVDRMAKEIAKEEGAGWP